MTIHLMGGDQRLDYLAAYLAEKGFPVSRSFHGEGTPIQWDADLLILPMPVSKDGRTLFAPKNERTILLKELFEKFRGGRIFGGVFPFYPEGLPLTDYGRAESILWANAALTAEAALGILLQSTPYSLKGEPVLILGGGRIAGLLGELLLKIGARPMIAARRESQLAACRARGLEARHFKDLPLKRFRLVCNTAPARLIPPSAFKPGTKILELASAPFGFDPEECLKNGLEHINGGALPGKWMPETAARLIGDYILKEMEENG